MSLVQDGSNPERNHSVKFLNWQAAPAAGSRLLYCFAGWPAELTRTLLRWQVVVFITGLTLAALAISLRPVVQAHLSGRIDERLQQAVAAIKLGDSARAANLAQSA